MNIFYSKRVSGLAGLALAWLTLAVLPAQADLVGWYAFTNPSNLGQDSSSYGNNGTNVSFVQPVGQSSDGVFGAGSAVFNGTGGGYLTFPIDASQTSMPNLTWGAWVKPSATNGVRDIIDIDHGQFGRNLNIDARSGGNFSAFTGSGVGNSGIAPSTTGWTFIAGVYQNNYYGPGDGKLALYVGNTDVIDFETSYGASPWDFITLGGSSSYGEFFGGEISDAFVFNSALDSQQMADLIAGGPGAVVTPEPQMLTLTGLGAAVWLAVRRKR